MTGELAANLLLIGLAATLLRAAIVDVRTFNISNELNLCIGLAAPFFWWASGAELWPDGGVRTGVALVVFAVFAGAFYIGMMGGGDVKMATAVALWFPPLAVLDFLMVMALAGGALTLIVVVRHRIAKVEGRPEVPYGVAIAAGGLWAIAARYLNQFG